MPVWMAGGPAAGMRAINNVVDVTNYVLLELGHPLHAFDHAQLTGRGSSCAGPGPASARDPRRTGRGP